MGLYLGGLIIGRIFASEICGAYFWEGLFLWGLLSEFYGILYLYISVGVKLCKKHKDEQAAKLPGPPFVGAFIPSCKLNGDYEEVQCHGSTGYCWCVDKVGNELPGTRTRGRLNCTSAGMLFVPVN